MKRINTLGAIISLFFMAGIFIGCATKENEATQSDVKLDKSEIIMTGITNHNDVKRIGIVVKIRPEKIEEYKALHADTNPGVRDLLEKYNMRNFSIFLTRLDDGNYYEFGYYEYWGENFESDMAKLDTEPRNIDWLNMCDPLQIPLEGETSWREMDCIYFNY